MEMKKKLCRFFKAAGRLTTAFIIVSVIVMVIPITSTVLQLLEAQSVIRLSSWAWCAIARVFFCAFIVQAILGVALILSPLAHFQTGGWSAVVSANGAAWSVIRFILIFEIVVVTLSWPGFFRICGSEDAYRSETNWAESRHDRNADAHPDGMLAIEILAVNN